MYTREAQNLQPPSMKADHYTLVDGGDALHTDSTTESPLFLGTGQGSGSISGSGSGSASASASISSSEPGSNPRSASTSALLEKDQKEREEHGEGGHGDAQEPETQHGDHDPVEYEPLKDSGTLSSSSKSFHNALPFSQLMQDHLSANVSPIKQQMEGVSFTLL